MSIYTIIVPSFNQEAFIKETLENLASLKEKAAKRGIRVQLIVVDNNSAKPTADIIATFKRDIDNLVIEPDAGQYDAINKGLALAEGAYWTWLNTDDLLDHDGFFKMTETLSGQPATDYIYGNVTYIDELSHPGRMTATPLLSLEQLLHKDASISQPGSFFKKSFTDQIGLLSPFHFAFDYDYILRCLTNEARVVKMENNVSFFRYYRSSKSGSQDYRFLKEQLEINKLHGGRYFSRLSLLLRLRILKRKLFN